jgi:hypothetical protein
VNRLSQSLHRQFVRDSQRQLADHLPGVRRHQCRPDDLAGPFAGVERREPLLSDSKLNATESPRLFATEKKSRDIIVLLLE